MTEVLREYWDLFLFDTLLWTGALIALVMVLRRPVARLFGAGAAYALWFIPLARLIIPPFTLPAWMAPKVESVPAPVAEETFAIDTNAIVMPVAEPGLAPPTVIAQSTPPIDFLTPLLAIWLAGALTMLVRRFWLYFALRRELLEDARSVGEVGSIRLIETDAISGPMAFGVVDRVIALPSGFMTTHDRQQRDLAIEHELAHHRGGDLLVNMAVQPLFAAHWFNPLGWFGWRALRRDQEAFCDARVVASRSREERVAYADIIADFARRPSLAPRPALAAPMACPVLGDKSIIHRLRSLSMSDISPRRRLLGRGALASAFLAVPLTASIAYAEVTADDQPAPPPPPPVEAPAPPPPPAPPEAPDAAEYEIEIEREFDEAERELAEAERELAEVETRIVHIERELERDEGGKVVKREIRMNGKDWNELDEEERAQVRAQLAEVRTQFAEGGEVREEIRKIRREMGKDGEMRHVVRVAVSEAHAAAAAAGERAPKVVMKCKDKESLITTEEGADGKVTMFVCEANADRLAMNALRTARESIASERNLTDEQRSEALRSIDEEIARLKSES